MTRIGPFVAGAAGILILPFAYWVRTWQSFATVRDICPRLFCDFTDYYYPMGEAIFRSGLPVEGFLYSPFIAILLAAFPPLGLDASLMVWGVLQVLFVFFYLSASVRSSQPRYRFSFSSSPSAAPHTPSCSISWVGK